MYHKDREIENITRERDVQKTRFLQVKQELLTEKKGLENRIKELEDAQK